MTKTIVAPSILSGDFCNMEKSIHKVEEWGGDWIHCDVMDGVYVPNLTFGMPMVAAIRKITAKPLDVHLMITKPEKYVKRFVEAGADIVTFHPEASECPLETLRTVKSEGKIAGIVFNPDVKIEDFEYLFPECDIIVVMTVFAGYGGQKLIDYCIDRIKYVKKRITEMGLKTIVEADGGIGEENIEIIRDAGVDVVVAGSAVFKSKNPMATIAALQGVTK